METTNASDNSLEMVSGVVFFLGFAALIGLNIGHNLNNIFGWMGIALGIFGCVVAGIRLLPILKMRSVGSGPHYHELTKQFRDKCLSLIHI